MGNQLLVGLDWLSFTVLDDSYTPEGVINLLGLDVERFLSSPNGANGYKRMVKYENISVMYDGAENMGIHVNVSGSSISTVLEAYGKTLEYDTPFGQAYDMWNETLVSRFFREIMSLGNITRLDLAIDDMGCRYYDLDEILQKLDEGKVISKWKSFRNLNENRVKDMEKVGHTIYFGSTQSEIQLRIYDKRLEQSKGKESTERLQTPWIRWELQLRKERASVVAERLANSNCIGDIAIGILSYYFRIIELDDSNKSRCSLDEKWQAFVSDIEQKRITLTKEEKTLDEEIEQFEHQNGRKIAKIFHAMSGDPTYFANLACRYDCKLTMSDKVQLRQIGCY